MPIFSYFAVVGSALVALLFLADATLPKSETPVVVSSNFYGMPKPWKPDPAPPVLTATPAPEPDMASAAVLAAAPKISSVPAATSPMAHMARADATPKSDAPKKKRVVRPHPRFDGRQNYALSRNGYDGGFFGGGSFGRF
jgi:hypothetical protein